MAEDNGVVRMAGSEIGMGAAPGEICPHCGAHLVSHKDYSDHLTQQNCCASGGSSRVYPGWRESMDGPFD